MGHQTCASKIAQAGLKARLRQLCSTKPCPEIFSFGPIPVASSLSDPKPRAHALLSSRQMLHSASNLLHFCTYGLSLHLVYLLHHPYVNAYPDSHASFRQAAGSADSYLLAHGSIGLVVHLSHDDAVIHVAVAVLNCLLQSIQECLPLDTVRLRVASTVSCTAAAQE